MAKSKSKPNGGMKTVDCREGCGNTMEISVDSTSGMCWRCVNKMMSGMPTDAYDEAQSRGSKQDFLSDDEFDDLMNETILE